jgi:hypothetical protein
MDTENKNRLEALLRIVQFPANTGFVPNARGVVLLGNIGAAATQMQLHATDQIGGKGVRHAGSILRRSVAEALRLELVDIGNTGRSLDPEAYPGVAAKFRLPTSDKSYQALRATAEAYLEAIGPVKAAFVEREYAADFDEQLSELIAGFDAATQETDAGLQEQSGGTAGLRVVSSRALRAVAELDAMITRKLRKSDPALLQVWKQVRHVERPPKARKAPAPSPKLAVMDDPQPMVGIAAAATGEEAAARVDPRVNGAGTYTNGSSVLLG